MDVITFLPTLLMQAVFIALYVVGVVRSRGVAQILLAIWLVINVISTLLSTILLPLITERIGFPGFGVISALVSGTGAILLAVALIVGRPGYRGEDRQGAPFAGQQPYGGQPPYGGIG